MKKYRLEILLFLLVWLGYGLTINSRNLEAFTLQQMGVEAIVERGVFYVEGSRSPQLQPLGDVFTYKGHKYAAKQPGQFMAGAAVYYVLHLFGLDYVKNFLMTSAVVTFFTASLMAALSAVIIYRMASELSKEGARRFWPLAVALLYAFGTTHFAYAGIAHHDAIASGFLILAFYFSFRVRARTPAKERGPVSGALAAGLFLGLTVTTSMLVFWPALAITLYFLSLKRFSLLPYFLLGALAGLAPLLIYDAVNFGNPFLLPNLAGNYSDTFFHLSLSNFRDKLGFYLKWTALYSPLLLVGLLGLWRLPRPFRREKVAMMGAVLFLCAYIFNIDTVGTCQYGPRYLLPAMAFGCLGLTGFSHLERKGARQSVFLIIVLMGLASFVINLVGALAGAMYCDLSRHAFWPHAAAIQQGRIGSFPLFSWLFIPTLICLYSLSKLIREGEREPRAQAATARRSKRRG